MLCYLFLSLVALASVAASTSGDKKISKDAEDEKQPFKLIDYRTDGEFKDQDKELSDEDYHRL